MILGINGIGRIGKLLLWYFIEKDSYDEIVINSGRHIGSSIEDIANHIKKDSSYGNLSNFLFGFKGKQKGKFFRLLSEKNGTMKIGNTSLRFLRKNRNPKDINWKKYGVRLAIDTTGQFLDPNLPIEFSKGSLRGHFVSGVEKLIVSAPFKIKKGEKMPSDAVTTVMGINNSQYNKKKHNIISNASCTTTCLSHIIKPIMDKIGATNILSANMITVHSATSSQKVIDSVPKTSATDLRKSRSFANNIILTSTGAARALSLVIPEMAKIDFMTKSVRIPTISGSMIILNLCLKGEFSAFEINEIYKKKAKNDKNDYLIYTEEQNVSSDIVGMGNAAIIEGSETDAKFSKKENITNAVIYAWYDNEMGYVSMLGRRALSIF